VGDFRGFAGIGILLLIAYEYSFMRIARGMPFGVLSENVFVYSYVRQPRS
jgi:hypothetical protein